MTQTYDELFQEMVDLASILPDGDRKTVEDFLSLVRDMKQELDGEGVESPTYTDFVAAVVELATMLPEKDAKLLGQFLLRDRVRQQNYEVNMRTRSELIAERNALIANVVGHGNQDGYDSHGQCDCSSCELLRKKLAELRSGEGWLTWRGGVFVPGRVSDAE